ncbi:MAG: ABC transporter permease subunit [Candidatus Marinimicrobia bacterium]|nr:ABC transporter permease subunit [Candidatus Neomarinimicrobiota bacterium]MDP7475656.1 ABC transporter permease subunit [Candidatus Neomarinimicrobiota bacterium]MEE1572496.1 ABC transporter permease subunit [Candidatus Neomarinimicrobiota bacterium]HJN68162.1 ABC transporter permease subunit [Candidatus Neomarinimicrobiota bacterium]
MFIILQMAPGGPLEKTIQEIQMGMMTQGEGGASGSGDLVGGVSLPKSALLELKRFYGFDKPIWQRYLIWLGGWPRAIKHRNIVFETDQAEIEKYVGKGTYVTVRKDGDNLSVYNTDGTENNIYSASLDNPEDVEDDGRYHGAIFETEFSGIFTGNLGKSYTYQQPVTEVMKPRFKVSILLGLSGWILSYLICIPLGIRKALNHGSPFDFVSSVIIFVAYSIPGWALGGVLLVLFGGGSFWDVFPLGGFHSPKDVWDGLSLWGKFWDQLHHMILPIIAWTIASFAQLTVLMKNSLLENLSQDYIRTAFAKGITEKRVIWMHAMRNSIIPIASGIGWIIAIVISGSYFIELVFNIDGFGKMGFMAILDRDYPITMGFLVIVVVIRLLANIISDIALALVDPRIRFK